jgi:hypothetical protein
MFRKPSATDIISNNHNYPREYKMLALNRMYNYPVKGM